MKRVFLTFIGILVTLVLWAGLLILAASQGWIKRSLTLLPQLIMNAHSAVPALR